MVNLRKSGHVSSLKEKRSESYFDARYYKLWNDLRKIRLQITVEDEEKIREIISKYII